jgi:AcrR family transcriptional regulator
VKDSSAKVGNKEQFKFSGGSIQIMQVLKLEIREKILTVAERLFYETGFSRTSTRSIAKEVGISVSNLYKYFADKQAIFSAIVDPFYHRTRSNLAALFDEEHEEMDSHIMDTAIQQIMSMMMTDRRKFVMLMGRSEGTRYAHFKEEIIGMMATHMSESVNHSVLKDTFILRVFARNFFEGILKIAESSPGNVTFVTDNVSALVRYHMAGIAQFY